MKLVVDFGNTVLKAALCEGVTLGKTYRYQGEGGISFILGLMEKNHPEAVIICSARELDKKETSILLNAGENVIIMDSANKEVVKDALLPEYITPDCAAAIIAVRHLFKDKPCSIFDFGTTITSSFIDAHGNYSGGSISPGCTTRFRSISRYARDLPLVSETDTTDFTGNSLEASIRSGVVSGIMFEIDGYISMFPENMAIFTGGDSIYFAKRTKNSIFVISNLVLMGLALIVEKYEKFV